MVCNEIRTYKNQRYDAEREFYGCRGARVEGCVFAGPADGESAFKEAERIEAVDCRFELRYPFWHNRSSHIINCEMTSTCRAPLWYSTEQEIENCRIYGTKAVRECNGITLRSCDVISDEFGWDTANLSITDTSLEGFYFAMRVRDLTMRRVNLKGKYSLQYVKGGIIEDCQLDTKDALWHAKNVVVRNSVIRGEYLAWYCENVTFENCVFSGTQPFCYCKGLVLINCEMHDCDLAFEKSEVTATVTTPVLSIKNPTAGRISLPSVGEIIRSDPESLCEIVVTEA